ncbi:MAG TPA: antibiotic biosynthesis monooxygenase [Parvularculaceae bacterium]|nr:antibiotic biosynthesis monooxygenase [Parvularculaceae bacterium]
MRAYIWSYRVKPECAAAFTRAYGPDGEWAQFFRRSPGYVRTDLLRDTQASDRFMTIDYFADKKARAALVDAHSEDYAAIDKKWQDATLEEAFIGEFEIEGSQR